MTLQYIHRARLQALEESLLHRIFEKLPALALRNVASTCVKLASAVENFRWSRRGVFIRPEHAIQFERAIVAFGLPRNAALTAYLEAHRLVSGDASGVLQILSSQFSRREEPQAPLEDSWKGFWGYLNRLDCKDSERVFEKHTGYLGLFRHHQAVLARARAAPTLIERRRGWRLSVAVRKYLLRGASPKAEETYLRRLTAGERLQQLRDSSSLGLILFGGHRLERMYVCIPSDPIQPIQKVSNSRGVQAKTEHEC